MKKLVPFCIYFLLTVFISSNSFAQQSADNDNWLKYNADKKSEFAAGALEFLIPVVGHAYAGDAERGIIPAVVSVGGIALMIGAASNANVGLATVGYVAYLGGRIWGIVSAVNTAEDYNSSLKSKLNLSLQPIKYPSENVGYGLVLSVSLN